MADKMGDGILPIAQVRRSRKRVVVTDMTDNEKVGDGIFSIAQVRRSRKRRDVTVTDLTNDDEDDEENNSSHVERNRKRAIINHALANVSSDDEDYCRFLDCFNDFDDQSSFDEEDNNDNDDAKESVDFTDDSPLE
jgi:hypothetical protein